jgi:phytoene dehydrogenase-like protein
VSGAGRRLNGEAAAQAVVVGSGPNGLASALTLARAGYTVDVFEGAETAGGGCRTAELTLSGFAHDVCSTVHPLLAASPFFNATDLRDVSLLTPEIAFAHPLDGGRAAAVHTSIEQTAATLGGDAGAYRRLYRPIVARADQIVPAVLAPLLRIPRHPLALARFGLPALAPVTLLARTFQTEESRALLAGLGAHSMRPLNAPGTGAFGVLLGVLAHTVGWPVVEGGSARVVDALIAELESLGGTVHTGRPIGSLDELPRAGVTMLDITPRQLLAMAGERLPSSYRSALRRFKYGPGAFKVDWALSGPVPWAADVCRQTPTIHLGGTLEEISHSEAQVAGGRHPERPFCIVVQPTVLDTSRAPAGRHTLYAYCHVPNGSNVDMSERIEAQIERFAPGFRELILARTVTSAVDSERHNPNYIGGDINCGAATLRQTILRPTPTARPYRTPLPGVYLCSSSTPPGGGVHGMCGANAAHEALKQRPPH